MNLNDAVNNYLSLGYEVADAGSKVCQDLILYKIGKSKYAHNITVKGGVIMHNISKSKRRTTRDLDLDFIKYSLDDNSIINFINKLNKNTISEIVLRLETILNNRRFTARLDNARSNWINISVNDVITSVILYFTSLETIQV